MKLAVMCSGNGSNFENIVRTCKEHEVSIMVHNRKDCGAAKRAEKLGIVHFYLMSQYEDDMIEVYNAFEVDLIVLAGWMRIISPKLINAFPNKIINVHPSLLPKYKGLHAVEQAMEAGEEVTGCSVHFVNEELDGGEVIIQGEVPILPDDTVKSLTRRIQLKEYEILPQAIEYVKHFV